jgi:CubicO group peptidase (beta-lactamase class C family)
MLWLVDRGYLSYDDKISKYWSEFGQKGKENITIRDLMRHQALNYVHLKGLSHKDFLDDEIRSKALAEQNYVGNDVGYHVYHRDMYVNEIVRRVDPKKRTIEQLISEEFVQPLDLQFTYGLKGNPWVTRSVHPPFVLNTLRILAAFVLPTSLSPHYYSKIIPFFKAFLDPTSFTYKVINDALPLSFLNDPETA